MSIDDLHHLLLMVVDCFSFFYLFFSFFFSAFHHYLVPTTSQRPLNLSYCTSATRDLLFVEMQDVVCLDCCLMFWKQMVEYCEIAPIFA